MFALSSAFQGDLWVYRGEGGGGKAEKEEGPKTEMGGGKTKGLEGGGRLRVGSRKGGYKGKVSEIINFKNVRGFR